MQEDQGQGSKDNGEQGRLDRAECPIYLASSIKKRIANPGCRSAILKRIGLVSSGHVIPLLGMGIQPFDLLLRADDESHVPSVRTDLELVGDLANTDQCTTLLVGS